MSPPDVEFGVVGGQARYARLAQERVSAVLALEVSAKRTSNTCAPQKVDPALIARFRPATIDFPVLCQNSAFLK